MDRNDQQAFAGSTWFLWHIDLSEHMQVAIQNFSHIFISVSSTELQETYGNESR